MEIKPILQWNRKNKVCYNGNKINNHKPKSPYKARNDRYQNFNGPNRIGNGYNDRNNHYSAHLAWCPIHRDGCNSSVCQVLKAIKKELMH